MTKCIIKAAEANELASVSEIHQTCFQGYFLSTFGPDFLRIYYKNYLSEDDHLLLVAKVSSQVVGFCAGTVNPDSFYKTLFRDHFVSISGIVGSRFLTSSEFRKSVLERTFFVKRALRSRFDFKQSATLQSNGQDHSDKEMHSRLLSIALLSEFRGQGISESLMTEFEAAMQRKGAVDCSLSVNTDNFGAIGLYKKTGWLVSSQNENSVHLIKEFRSDT